MQTLSDKTVTRIFKYRQLLLRLIASGAVNVFSRQLAVETGGSAEQVRRDFMNFKLKGTPQRGYVIKEMLAELDSALNSPGGKKTILVGVGNLGRAILSYFAKKSHWFIITAAFDSNPEKTERVLSGCSVHHISQMGKVIREQKAAIGIITVPAGSAQIVADGMIRAGIRGIVNFAPVTLKLPENVYLENMDITLSIEKTGYFAGKACQPGRGASGKKRRL